MRKMGEMCNHLYIQLSMLILSWHLLQGGKLNEDGSPMEPSEEELMSPETAKLRARQTGADYLPNKDSVKESSL